MKLSRINKAFCALSLAALLVLPLSAFASKDATIAVNSTFTTMDPYDANDNLTQYVLKTFYEGLFKLDKDLHVQPVLATGWEVTPDGLVYTVGLKKGIKFHDGTDFNAHAVKANFDRVTDTNNHLKRYILFKNIDKTEALDDYTVQITLKEPFSAFINQLAHPTAMMISPAAMEKGNEFVAFNPVGTGPFVFEEWRATDYLKGKKNENYWKSGYPKIDSITYVPVADNNTRAAMLQTGEADMIKPVPFEQVKVLEGKKDIDIIVSPSIFHRFMSMNTLQKPFDNPKVREALNLAINKEALAKVAYNGYAEPTSNYAPKGIDFAIELDPIKYDPKRARELLKEAGYPNGFETVLWAGFNNTSAQKTIQFIQQQLAQIGVKAKIQALETGQRVNLVESQPEPQQAPVRLYFIGWSASTGEADWALRPLLATEAEPPQQLNTAYYSNAEFDKALKDALLTTDREKKQELYTKAQKELEKDKPWVPLVTEMNVTAKNGKLSGVDILLDGGFDITEIDLAE